MDLNARVDVNCGRNDRRTDGWTEGRTGGRKTGRLGPISHLAKAGATKKKTTQNYSKCLQLWDFMLGTKDRV